MKPITLIANPENRRAEFFREACQRLNVKTLKVIAWDDYLRGSACLPETGLLRIESPGENTLVEAALMALGESVCAAEGLYPAWSPAECVAITQDRGLIGGQRQWYLGWQKCLAMIGEHLGAYPALKVMNSPQAIALLFDKYACQQYLAQHGVPIPRLLGQPRSFDELMQVMDESSCSRAFIKPSHSSSASGVVAFERHRNRLRMTTSATIVTQGAETRLYNSLRMRRYEALDECRKLINVLASENLLVEQWFPKASLAGRAFDLRILVIAGQATHVVVRTSRSPITNLHLGNERGELGAVRDWMGEDNWNRAIETAVQAARTMPDCTYLAVDLLVGVRASSCVVAELNAFGDLIPRIVNDDGDDTYTAELKAAFSSRSGSI